MRAQSVPLDEALNFVDGRLLNISRLLFIVIQYLDEWLCDVEDITLDLSYHYVCHLNYTF